MCACSCVRACVKGKADKLHFLLAADQVPPARSPINMLKDDSVRKRNEGALLLQRVRGDEGGKWRECEGSKKKEMKNNSEWGCW